MHKTRTSALALLAALLIGAACSQTPAATPRTDTSPVVTAPATSPSSPDASPGETDDADETEDASPS